jgi:tRNA-specific 2-thiouridylase
MGIEYNRSRIVVAMSGGVDSSVAAHLVIQEGYEVIGVNMRLWKPLDSDLAREKHSGCCHVRDIEDARRVAQVLDIPFYVINFTREFARDVIDYFCREYLEGRTPNPCILCNEKVKFGRLWDNARALGAGMIATGHYARVEYDRAGQRYLLLKGVDWRKDQSYVLFSLSQEQLSHIRLPLGGRPKDWVRKRARDLGLRVSDKKDSQELCFVPGGNYRDFLRKRLGSLSSPGPIVDRQGRVLGMHQGISDFTIGQRRGLGACVGYPLYVVEIETRRNSVVVGPEKEALVDRLVASRINWVGTSSLTGPQRVDARIRYNHPGAEAIVDPISKDRAVVHFKTPQRAVTPGQAVVFYEGDVVLGGGWIDGRENGR